MRKILSMILAVVMVAGVLPAMASAAEVSGTTGDCTWTFDDATSTLTVSGTGAMEDYASVDAAPWYTYKDSIKEVKIEEGVTSIAAYAFYQYPSLATVNIAGSVTSFGRGAFQSCPILQNIRYWGKTEPGSVDGDYAFTGCARLWLVHVPTDYQGDDSFLGKLLQKDLVPAVTSYTVTVVNGTGGGEFTEGEDVLIMAAEIEGKRFVYWTSEDGVEFYKYNYPNTRFTMPAKNVTVTATYEDIPTYTVTVDTDITNGSVTADKETAAMGETVTVTVTPDAGYKLESLTFNGEDVTAQVSEGKCIFTMPAEDVTVTAMFEVVEKKYSGGTGTKENPYILSTPEDLIAFNTAISNDYGLLDAADDCGLGMYHGYYFELSNDIDMSGVEWTPVSFCGNLDGNGYAIKNLSVTEADNGDGEYWAAMFAQLINATVSDIVFENCSASISSETSSSRDIYVAIVAANAIASKLENIKVIDSDIIQNGYAKNFGYAAYVVALADITNITGCIVKGGTLSVNTTNTSTMKVGGITGCLEDLFYEYIADYGNPYNMVIGKGSGYGIYDCYVKSDIYVNGGAASHVAGIVGMTCTDYLDNTEEYNGVAVEIKNCLYEGVITAVRGTASGISGWDEPEDVIIDCVSLATLFAPKTFALCELPETIINSYYVADEADENGGRTAEQFADGSVCASRGGHFSVDSTCVLERYVAPVINSITATANPSKGGSVIATVNGISVAQAKQGATVTVKVSENEHYELVRLTVDGKDVTAEIVEGKYSFTMPDKAVKTTAVFAPVVATVTDADGKETNYINFDDALVAAMEKENSVLKLLDNIDLKNNHIEITSGKFTVDLNGKFITSSANTLVVKNDANVTVCDNTIEQKGKIETTGAYTNVIELEGSSTLVLNSGTIESNGSIAIDMSETSANLIINGGAVTSTDSKSILASGYVKISGGTFNKQIHYLAGTLSFEGNKDPSGIKVYVFGTGGPVEASAFSLPDGFCFTYEGRDTPVDVLTQANIFEIKKAVVYGDVNGDGEANMLDSTVLSRYFAKWNGYEALPNEVASDVNLDGTVNAIDRMILLRHFAKWTGYEALPHK